MCTPFSQFLNNSWKLLWSGYFFPLLPIKDHEKTRRRQQKNSERKRCPIKFGRNFRGLGTLKISKGLTCSFFFSKICCVESDGVNKFGLRPMRGMRGMELATQVTSTTCLPILLSCCKSSGSIVNSILKIPRQVFERNLEIIMKGFVGTVCRWKARIRRHQTKLLTWFWLYWTIAEIVVQEQQSTNRERKPVTWSWLDGAVQVIPGWVSKSHFSLQSYSIIKSKLTLS